VRFVALCGFIAAVAMLSPRLTPRQAGVIALAGGLGTVVGAVVLLALTRRLARAERDRLPGLTRAQRGADAFLRLLRATGLPLLGLAFFLTWSFVYCGMYWFAPYGPDRAFTGLEPHPRYADFFYYAVSTGLISPPGDIIAHSRGVRTATIIEMLAGLALLTTYASSLLPARLGRREEEG